MKIMDYVKSINASVNDLVSQEKAKKIRKRLIIIGIICLVLGVVILSYSMISSILSFFEGMESMYFNFQHGMISFILFIPGSFLLMAGITLLRAGLAILFTKETSNFVDKTINDRCSCGHTITSDQMFCPKCGRPTRQVCSNCGHVLEPKDEYCRKCGIKINK